VTCYRRPGMQRRNLCFQSSHSCCCAVSMVKNAPAAVTLSLNRTTTCSAGRQHHIRAHCLWPACCSHQQHGAAVPGATAGQRGCTCHWLCSGGGGGAGRSSSICRPCCSRGGCICGSRQQQRVRAGLPAGGASSTDASMLGASALAGSSGLVNSSQACASAVPTAAAAARGPAAETSSQPARVAVSSHPATGAPPAAPSPAPPAAPPPPLCPASGCALDATARATAATSARRRTGAGTGRAARRGGR
jgi:hypothetical protein